MNIWTFTVDGPLWGYRQGRKEAHRPARVDFKNRVRLLANIEGVPGGEDLAENTFLDVRIHWKRTARIDGKNILGLIEDALWTQDRNVAGGLWYMNTLQPREEVIITVMWPAYIVTESKTHGRRVSIGAGEA